MARRAYERLAWEDRFTRPDAEALRAGLHGMPRKLFDALRKYLLHVDDVSESFAWYGESWRWAIEYRLSNRRGSTNGSGRSASRAGQSTDDQNLLALLIPSPEDLQLAMPIDPDLVGSLPMRQLKRAVRDGLDLAAEPFDTRWGVWSIQQPHLAEDLKNLLKRKVDHMRRSVG